MKIIPEIGKTYNAFDDGKVKECRRYQVTVTDITPFAKIDYSTLERWKAEVEQCHWLYAKTTDYFIFADSNEPGQTEQDVFVRTQEGGWFGIGEFYGSSSLDVDGESYAWYLEMCRK